MTTSLPLQLPAAFTDRAVRFGNGRCGIRGGLHVEIREPAVAGPPAVLDFIASNETLDRYDEIILASGWRLENYRRNPVFQNAHQYGDVIFTLGKALITEVRGRGAGSAKPYLYQRIEFAVDVNPLARIAYGLYRGKFLNAVSVGFIPLRWESPADPAKAGYRRKYLEQELLEVSAVGIPANPEALQLGLKLGALERADLKQLLELVRRMSIRAGAQLARDARDGEEDRKGFNKGCDEGRGEGDDKVLEDFRSEMAAPDTDACASGVRGNEAQFLQLASALRDILRRT